MESSLMRAPTEVRMLIYEYLFDDGGHESFSIRNGRAGKLPKCAGRTRSRYYVLDRSFHRRCYDTTYRLHTEGATFCPALMRVNKTVYEETSYLVYGGHSFDFGSDIEAVEPFLADLTARTRELIQEISLYKRGPVTIYENDRAEWRNVCDSLRSHTSLRKLRLVVQGGRPNVPWEGPKEFSAEDFQLLAGIRHESLEWTADLGKLEGIKELEIVGDVQCCAAPNSSNMVVFAAFSASIERGLAEFLRRMLHLS
ncbi:hypothetical protein F5Y15DRAFT_309707 [Xylariaceae sp. FL0016]|nr:hypothetical protein F5Y15DRAFT_309707 [Xylariaceae sp. FL0016]